MSYQHSKRDKSNRTRQTFVAALPLLLCLVLAACTSNSPQVQREQTGSSRLVLETDNLIAFWDFQEQAGQDRVAQGTSPYRLREQAGEVERITPQDGAPFGDHAALLKEGQWLLVPRDEIKGLNIHGTNAQVSVIAWIKRHSTVSPRCEAVAGVWDEPHNLRQYALFLNLQVNKNHPNQRIYDKVAGHISDTGGPTPGFRWCYDVAQSKSSVPYGQWVCVGFTYDGQEIRSYYNGALERHEGYNPFPFSNGIYNGGSKGAGFKVGNSNELLAPNCNWFAGVIGGVAVYNRALTPEEMQQLTGPTRRLATSASESRSSR